MEPKGLRERGKDHCSPPRDHIRDLELQEYVRHLTAPSPRSQAKHLRLRETQSPETPQLCAANDGTRDSAPRRSKSHSRDAARCSASRSRQQTCPKHPAKPKQKRPKSKRKRKHKCSRSPDTTLTSALAEAQDRELAHIACVLCALQTADADGAAKYNQDLQRLQLMKKTLEGLRRELQARHKDLQLGKAAAVVSVREATGELQRENRAAEGLVQRVAEERQELEVARIDWRRLKDREEQIDRQYEELVKQNASLESQFNLLGSHVDIEVQIQAQRSLLESLRSQINRENELRPQLIENLTKLAASKEWLMKKTEQIRQEINERRRGCELLDKEHQIYQNGKEEERLATLRASRALKQSELQEMRKFQQELALKLKIQSQDSKLAVFSEPENLTNLKAEVAHLDADKELLIRKLTNLEKHLAASKTAKEKSSDDLKRLQEIQAALVERYVEIKSEVKKVQLELIGPTKQSRKLSKPHPSDNPFRSPDVTSARLTEISQKYSSVEACERLKKEWRDYRANLGLPQSFTNRSARIKNHLQQAESADNVAEQAFQASADKDNKILDFHSTRKLGLATNQTAAMTSRGIQGRFGPKDKTAHESAVDLGSTQDTKLVDAWDWKHRSSGGVAFKSLSNQLLEPLAEENEA